MNTPNSETPRTDAAIYSFYDESTGQSTSVVDPEDMAKLEKELNETRQCLLNRKESLKHSGKSWVKAKTELDMANSHLKASEQVLAGIRTGLQREFDDKITDADDLLDLMEKFIDHHKEKERANSEMRETLKLARNQLLERCGLDKDSDHAVAVKINKALSSTSGQSYIPRENK